MGMAKQLIEQFWEIQKSRDYTRLVELFSDDAVYEDCLLGKFEGKAAIAQMMEDATKKLGDADQYFDLIEIAANDTVGWSRWIWKGPGIELNGVSINKIKDGKIVYNLDFYNPAEAPQF